MTINGFRTIMLSSLALVLSAGAALAQQEAGDKKVGLSGAAFFTHTHVTGNLNAEASIGKYLSTSNYFGVSVGPSLTFGDGSTSGSFNYGAEYRRLFGSKGSRIWPFIGVLGGGETE